MRISAVLKSLSVALFVGLSATPAAIAQDTIKVGAVLPMSGPNAELGEIFSRAAQIAIDHANTDKMLSKKIEMLIEDSQATPQGGVVAMNKLVNVSKVPYVLGAYTAVSKAIAPIGEKARVVTINGGAVGPDLAELGDYFWNVIPLVNFEAEVLIPYVVKEKGLKNVALIYVDDPLGEAVQKVLRAEVPKAGGKIVGELQIPRTAQQFASIAAKVRELKSDVIYIASFGSQPGQIVKQLRDNGVTQQIVSYSAFSVPTIGSLPEAKGSLYTTQAADFNASDLGKRVAKEYKEKTGKDANAYVANYYNAIMVFAQLAQKLEKAGKPITGENLLAERRASPNFELVGGKMVFQSNGTVAMPIQIQEIDGTGSGKRIK
jgi:branched-chain amino acid transport system substrate-binding protein